MAYGFRAFETTTYFTSDHLNRLGVRARTSDVKANLCKYGWRLGKDFAICSNLQFVTFMTCYYNPEPNLYIHFGIRISLQIWSSYTEHASTCNTFCHQNMGTVWVGIVLAECLVV